MNQYNKTKLYSGWKHTIGKNMVTLENNKNPCWICREPANSGEHMIKASDLKDIFPVSTSLYFHRKLSDKFQSIPVQSIKSDRLKFSDVICHKCNNQKTQPFDMAWDQLSKFMRRSDFEANDKIRLKRIWH